ncbi:3-deoxy-7-phosphoheptulonate synthase [Megamonas hypermegale]|uniref:3-deoxy-7-phosphoheptulonate synthase n=1 Tax=Megamonas hypermegale TaxID=158847 RepID=A0A921HN84_9FIRM|nr:3-deoxy-7-phosphoheptulonate synthase [Megamonas hypermegale]MDM8143118.1 3-deoxy-7-phosphoheptulonate synthase [Megamonas hypermegale]HJF84744.1 3-deoxy-7-phosphoheptulonate synthase [Megamonas hypermegale]
MIIVMKPEATANDLEAVKNKIKNEGLDYHLSQGSSRTIVGVIGDKKKIAMLQMNSFSGVEKTVSITEKYKLVSREFKKEDSVVDVDGVKIGGGHFAVMAGPCSVESREQLLEAARAVKECGAQFLRGGAFKPRTSPYDFQGLGVEGLKMMRSVADETGLKVVTEIVNINDIDTICQYADMLQIGARNMQNFQLLKEVGLTRKPVLLKRGLSATISEWLNAAEYIASGGNYNIVFCERGIRTYETFTRNTLDLSAVAAVKELSHLPIIVDPSHGTGRWQMVQPMARAAVAAGADGLMIEVHPHPEVALSDGDQSLKPANFKIVMDEVKQIMKIMGKTL